MTDRERVEQMARDAEERRAREKVEREQQEAVRGQAEQDRVAEAKRKTDELRAYCEETFKGFKLVPTGHEVGVGTCKECRLYNVPPDDKGEYVHLHITHWDDETGNFEGQIPILLCRYYNGMYEVLSGSDRKQQWGDNLPAFKENMVRIMAGLGREELGAIFKLVKTRLKR